LGISIISRPCLLKIVVAIVFIDPSRPRPTGINEYDNHLKATTILTQGENRCSRFAKFRVHDRQKYATINMG
ncbi:MAG: hypothetical protein ACI9LU_001212, partial [Polaribacter sp.]